MFFQKGQRERETEERKNKNGRIKSILVQKNVLPRVSDLEDRNDN